MPVLITSASHEAITPERVTLEAGSEGKVGYNEKFIQGLLFNHSNLIPISDIEPALAPLVPVCTELPIRAGAVDNSFVTPTGHLVIAECKQALALPAGL